LPRYGALRKASWSAEEKKLSSNLMTVGVLIERLRALPADAVVLVEGYEKGLDAVVSLSDVEVMQVPLANEWDGEFREAGRPGEGGLPGVVLVGRRGHLR
jgi:hypothetical protein